MTRIMIVEVDYQEGKYSYEIEGVDRHTLHEAEYGSYGDFLTNIVIDLYGHRREAARQVSIVLTPNAEVRMQPGEKGVLSRLEVLLNHLPENGSE